MINLVTSLKTNIHLKAKSFTIDNLIFKLHYRFTTILLLVMPVLLTGQELLGKHIECLSDKGGGTGVIPQAVMNRFCFFSTTYTVVKYMNATLLKQGDIAHPGVGANRLDSDDEIKHHAYYQWVPMVLTIQAIMFYIPHFIWKSKEGERMKKLSMLFENAIYATYEPLTKIQNLPTKADVQTNFNKIKKYFKERLIVNRSWTFWLIFCEFLNLINIIINIFLTNAFLGGQFLSLGPKLIEEGLESDVDPLDVIFPKMTKCVFYKYGASGNIQAIDALCVMALNILNEKLYMVLWFWFLFVLIITILGIFWRILTFFLYKHSTVFNKLVFSVATNSTFKKWKLDSVIYHCNFYDWLFLVYLAKNMDGPIFKWFFSELADDLNPLLIYSSEDQTEDNSSMQNYETLAMNDLYEKVPEKSKWDEVVDELDAKSKEKNKWDEIVELDEKLAEKNLEDGKKS